MAEKEGFEPSIPFWGIHDFQSCALGQLRDFSIQAFSKLEYITPFVLICQDLFFILLKLFYKAMKNPAHIRERDFGASDLTRTGDLLITSEMHYRLCYTSKLFSKPVYYNQNYRICQPIIYKGFCSRIIYSAAEIASCRTVVRSPKK